MGLFGKLKNIFYDEEIVEVPSQEEKVVKEKVVERPRIEPIEVPKKEEVEREKRLTNTFSERDLFKSEPSFKFPVIDEDDEDDMPLQTRTRSNTVEIEKRSVQAPPREREMREVREVRKPSVTVNNNVTPNVTVQPTDRNTEKVFKPSPVISPVYGILDKNYKKEEIIEKKEPTVRPSGGNFNYDYVRRKAYGTLEDELENTLTKLSNEVMNDVEELVSTEAEVDNSKSIEALLSEIEGNVNISIGEIEEKAKDVSEREEEEVEFKMQMEEEIKIDNDVSLDVEDKTLEHDLFNLIDSMYEEREGE